MKNYNLSLIEALELLSSEDGANVIIKGEFYAEDVFLCVNKSGRFVVESNDGKTAPFPFNPTLKAFRQKYKAIYS